MRYSAETAFVERVFAGNTVFLNIQAGQAPFVGKIAVPELECFLYAADPGGTGEIHSHFVPALILGQYFIYNYAYKFSGLITKPESQRCDFSVCVGTGNHLYRHVNAQNAFQGKSPFPKEYIRNLAMQVLVTPL